MIRPVVACQGLAFLISFIAWIASLDATAQTQTAAKAESNPGQFFTVTEPITNETIDRIRAATRNLVDKNAAGARGQSPILIFQFLPGETAPGGSDFGASFDLANFISKELGGAKLTVAYIPEPLKGFAVLPAVACTEIIMGSKRHPRADHPRESELRSRVPRTRPVPGRS